jgi:hypothetical protein
MPGHVKNPQIPFACVRVIRSCGDGNRVASPKHDGRMTIGGGMIPLRISESGPLPGDGCKVPIPRRTTCYGGHWQITRHIFSRPWLCTWNDRINQRARDAERRTLTSNAETIESVAQEMPRSTPSTAQAYAKTKINFEVKGIYPRSGGGTDSDVFRAFPEPVRPASTVGRRPLVLLIVDGPTKVSVDFGSALVPGVSQSRFWHAQ